MLRRYLYKKAVLCPVTHDTASSARKQTHKRKLCFPLNLPLLRVTFGLDTAVGGLTIRAQSKCLARTSTIMSHFIETDSHKISQL